MQPTESYFVIQRAPGVEEYLQLRDPLVWTSDLELAVRCGRRAAHAELVQVLTECPDSRALVRKAVKRTVEKPGRSGWVVRSLTGEYLGERSEYVAWCDSAGKATLYSSAWSAANAMLKCLSGQLTNARMIAPITLPGESVMEWIVVDEFEEVGGE